MLSLKDFLDPGESADTQSLLKIDLAYCLETLPGDLTIMLLDGKTRVFHGAILFNDPDCNNVLDKYFKNENGVYKQTSLEDSSSTASSSSSKEDIEKIFENAYNPSTLQNLSFQKYADYDLIPDSEKPAVKTHKFLLNSRTLYFKTKSFNSAFHDFNSSSSILPFSFEELSLLVERIQNPVPLHKKQERRFLMSWTFGNLFIVVRSMLDSDLWNWNAS